MPWEAQVTFHLRDGRPEEARLLSELALRSKAHWGYDAAFLEACRRELTLASADVPLHRTRVAEDAHGWIVGFATIVGVPPDGEIGAFFVEPERIGAGVGRVLWVDAVARARREGFARLRIDADPDAEGFYRRMGALRVGVAPSGSIPGRVLPRLVFGL